MLKYLIAGCLTISFFSVNLFAEDKDIFKFIQENKISEIKTLVSSKNIAMTNKNGDSLLMHAVRTSKDPAIINFLAATGANVNERDKKGYTPLMIAVKSRYLYPDIAIALIENKADVNAVFNDSFNDEDKNTVLMYACDNTATRPKVVQALLEAGADINPLNKQGNSAFLASVKYGNSPEIINLLISAGAKIEDRDTKGYTPLMIAVKSRYLYPDIAIALIKNKADVNATFNDSLNDEDKNTVLMYACANTGTKPKVVQALLETGADINALNKQGNSAFLASVKYGNSPEIINLLISAGAKIEDRDTKGYTPLMIAVKSRYLYPDIAIALIKNKADVNAVFNDPLSDEDKNTILLYACANASSKPKVIEALIEYKADVNTKNSQGQTPLILAAKNSTQEIVKILLKNGAELNARDNSGKTAQDYAKGNSRIKEKDLSKLK